MKKNIYEKNICPFCENKENCDKNFVIIIEESNYNLRTLRCDKYNKISKEEFYENN